MGVTFPALKSFFQRVAVLKGVRSDASMHHSDIQSPHGLFIRPWFLDRLCVRAWAWIRNGLWSLLDDVFWVVECTTFAGMAVNNRGWKQRFKYKSVKMCCLKKYLKKLNKKTDHFTFSTIKLHLTRTISDKNISKTLVVKFIYQWHRYQHSLLFDS